MDREEIKLALTAAGLEFDGRWNTEKLFNLLQTVNVADVSKEDVSIQPDEPQEPTSPNEELIANITDSILTQSENKDILSIDRMWEKGEIHMTQGGEVQTKSGIIIPTQKLSSNTRSRYNYYADELADKSIVHRKSERQRDEIVREYSQALHGENYRALAKQFIDKNNR